MSILFRIVYAAHANGTHHKLALDGLRGLKCEHAEGWTRVFLKHAERFMDGSKAPDNEFKDFKNHVLHVGDHYWGGAPEQTVVWFDKTVAALKAEQWEDAVYAAGVTSHYFTDPMMPFHTGQTEAENAIHRAAEWSINRSYNDLRRTGEEKSGVVEVKVPDGDDWLKHMVCDGADLSHRYYEKLIAHYDIHRGVTDPPAGLDGVARGFVADLLVRAATGFGLVLDRALTASGTRPPDVALTMDTVMAAVKIPAKALAKRLTNAEDRKVVEAMYDELKSTGRVDKTLPEDLRSVRDQHAEEILKPKLAAQSQARAERLGSTAKAPVIAKPPAQPTPVAPALSSLSERLSHTAPPRTAPTMPTMPTLSPMPAPLPAPAPPLSVVSTSVPSVSANRDRTPRIYLAANDMLEAAPSIGPKMAERFLTLGIKTVGDFLEADPAKLAARLADRRIGDTTIEDWQSQARLVMEIAGLRGTHAQLLTGAGFRSTAAIAAADAAKLSSDVLRFAGTQDGRRVLRDGEPPDVEKIKGWVDAARIAQAA